MTTAIPEQHLTTCHLIDIITKVIVRTEDQFGILRQLIHDLLGITRGHHHIRQSLHSCRRINITDDLITRMLLFIFLQILSLAGISQRAACIQVRTEHSLIRREQFTGLCHKMHTTHDHDLCIRLCSLTRQC